MSDPAHPKSEAESVAAIVRAANQPFISPTYGAAFYPDRTIKNLELLGDKPRRKRAQINLYETASFISYVLAHKEEKRTLILGKATEAGGSFNAIIDYHGEGEAGSPSWGDHNVTLTLATTPEWRRWLSKNNTMMGQGEFAEFIEDNQLDIIEPDAGTLLDIAQLLTGKKSVKFKSGKNLKNGAIKFEYDETIEATNSRTSDSMELPAFIKVRLCPFVGVNGVEITARLRFRISDSGGLSFQYILNRPFKVIEEAFNAAVAQIQTETSVPVLLGEGFVKQPFVTVAS